MYERPQYQILKNRIENEARSKIQVIMGSRQVGKTTLVHQFLKATRLCSHYASADGIAGNDSFWIAAQWEASRIKIKMAGALQGVLVLDEVQKIPNWSEYIKREWDEDSMQQFPMKVILLGSSTMMITKGLSESLAGRFEQIPMGHWSYPEMQAAFGYTLEDYIWFGAYPGSAGLIGDEARWGAYIRDSLIESAISRDVLQMTRIDKPAVLRRLFDLGCHYSAQIISYTKILGQLQDAGNTTTLAHYLELLDIAGMLSGIQKFSEGISRQRGSSPKFLVHNNALKTAVQFLSRDLILHKPELWGRWVESAVGAHLINFRKTEGFELSYWRQGDAEVDFVLKYNNNILALEVKSGSKTSNRGMSVFRSHYPQARTVTIGRDGLPLEAFFCSSPSTLFI